MLKNAIEFTFKLPYHGGNGLNEAVRLVSMFWVDDQECLKMEDLTITWSCPM